MPLLAALLAFLLALMVAPSPVAALGPDEILADPRLEARARALSAELRCLVCQNQSIDDSDAPLARDLRMLVRERLKAGDSDADVMRFVVARYGEFVLLRPPFGWHTLALWLAPLVVLLLAVGTIAARMLQRPVLAAAGVDAADTPPRLTPEEEERLAAALGEAGDSGPAPPSVARGGRPRA